MDIDAHHMPQVAVCVLTYKRPDSLARLLQSLRALVYGGEVRVLVVDNDPAASAQSVVEQYYPAADYVVETRPGIASARNAALNSASCENGFVAFVDDDEVVSSTWLQKLIACADTYAADIVAGPVRRRLPPEAPKWIQRGGFYARQEFADGVVLKSAGCGNVALRHSSLAKFGSPRFDESFNLTGGEDSELFGRLARMGARIVWAAEALVYEDVELSRTSIQEVVRRSVRGGTTRGRLLRRRHLWVLVFAYGLLRTSEGTGRTLLGLLRAGYVRAADAIPLLDGIGIVLACFGRDIAIYGRAE